jgi:hypothetical protein
LNQHCEPSQQIAGKKLAREDLRRIEVKDVDEEDYGRALLAPGSRVPQCNDLVAMGRSSVGVTNGDKSQ